MTMKRLVKDDVKKQSQLDVENFSSGVFDRCLFFATNCVEDPRPRGIY